MDLAGAGTPQISSPNQYRRRLDRTPDRNFHILPDQDQVRVNALRTRLEETKTRIGRLTDENDEKDYIIDEERRLRQVAEDNLQKHLVDIYNNPDVISELRHRLPRAKKVYTINHEPAMTMNDNYRQANNFIDEVSVTREEVMARYRDDGGTMSNINKQSRNHLFIDAKSQPLTSTSVGQQVETLGQTHPAAPQHSVKPRQRDPYVAGSHLPRDLDQPSANLAVDHAEAWSTLVSISRLLPPYINPNIYVSSLSPESCSSRDSSIYHSLPQVREPTAGSQERDDFVGQQDKAHISRSSQVNTIPQILSTTATQTTWQDIPALERSHMVSEPSLGHKNVTVEPIPSRSNFTIPESVPTHSNLTVPESFPTSKNLTVPESLPTSKNFTIPESVSTNKNFIVPESLPSHSNFPVYESVPTLSSFLVNEPALQFSSHSTSLPSLHHFGEPGQGQPASLPAQLTPCGTSRYFPSRQATDHVSHTSRLLVEIATLKKENEELREKLSEARYEIESGKSRGRAAEDAGLDRIGSLVEEIRTAEKSKEVALRMLVGDVDEEQPPEVDKNNRTTQEHISKCVQAGGFSDSEPSEAENMSEKLCSIGEMNAGRDQLNVQLLLARQRDIMKVEMQKVLDERNEAKQRVRKLEKKLSSLELSYYKDNRANALLAKLRVTEKERDMAVARLKNVTQDVNETKLVYSLHKALLSDSQDNQTSKSTHSGNDLTGKRLMTSALSKEAEEKARLVAKMTLMEKEKQSQLQQMEKLQQLVQHQREKINVLCAGPVLLDRN